MDRTIGPRTLGRNQTNCTGPPYRPRIRAPHHCCLVITLAVGESRSSSAGPTARPPVRGRPSWSSSGPLPSRRPARVATVLWYYADLPLVAGTGPVEAIVSRNPSRTWTGPEIRGQSAYPRQAPSGGDHVLGASWPAPGSWASPAMATACSCLRGGGQGRGWLPMVRSTQALEVGRLVAAAHHLGHDMVDVGSGTTTGPGVRGPLPLASGMLEQLPCPSLLPLRPVPSLRRRPAPAGDAAPRTGGDTQAARAGMGGHRSSGSAGSSRSRTVSGAKTPARMTTPATMSMTGPRIARSSSVSPR